MKTVEMILSDQVAQQIDNSYDDYSFSGAMGG